MTSVTVENTRMDILAGTWRMSIRHPVLLGVCVLAAMYLATTGATGAHHVALSIFERAFAGTFTALFALAVGVAITSVGMALFASRDRGVLGKHRYEIVEGGLRESTAVNEQLIKWGGAYGLLRTRKYFYVRVTAGAAHIIPRRFFADAAADDCFWNALQPLVAAKKS